MWHSGKVITDNVAIKGFGIAIGAYLGISLSVY